MKQEFKDDIICTESTQNFLKISNLAPLYRIEKAQARIPRSCSNFGMWLFGNPVHAPIPLVSLVSTKVAVLLSLMTPITIISSQIPEWFLLNLYNHWACLQANLLELHERHSRCMWHSGKGGFTRFRRFTGLVVIVAGTSRIAIKAPQIRAHATWRRVVRY